MLHATPNTTPVLDAATKTALDGFLDRYDNPSTRELYEIDLRIFLTWCRTNGIEPLEIRRPQLEAFSRYLTIERRNSTATVAHRLGVVRSFYEVAVDDELLDRNPARLLRVPRVHTDPARMIGLDRREFGAILTAARHHSPNRWALVALLGLMGLRVTEACSIDVESFHQRVERGHQVISFIGKGSKPATAPIPVPVLRALEEARGDRTTGALLVRHDGERLDRRTAHRWVKRLGVVAGIDKTVTPHALRRTYVTLALDAGVSPREVQRGARHAKLDTTMRYDVARLDMDRHANHSLAAFVAGAM